MILPQNVYESTVERSQPMTYVCCQGGKCTRQYHHHCHSVCRPGHSSPTPYLCLWKQEKQDTVDWAGPDQCQKTVLTVAHPICVETRETRHCAYCGYSADSSQPHLCGNKRNKTLCSLWLQC